LHCAGIEPATSCAVGEFSHHYATSAVKTWTYGTGNETLDVNIHTYRSRFIPEGVAEASQMFLRDTRVLPKLLSHKEHCTVAGGKLCAVLYIDAVGGM
jgi:hypothetical protein